MASWHPTTVLYGRRPGDTFEQGGWKHPELAQPRRHSDWAAFLVVLAVGFLLTVILLAIAGQSA